MNEFITNSTFYKESEGITDANALLGLPLLLEGNANTWWQGIKAQVTTWKQATELLKEEFAPSKPDYKIYAEIFRQPQGEGFPTGPFITTKRALFADLKNPQTEEVQLDMVYGMLHLEIRERVARTTVSNFEELKSAARDVEAALRERRQQRRNREEPGPSKPKPGRCPTCRGNSHPTGRCPRAARPPGRGSANPREELRCYGCDKPGVIKRNCPNCSRGKTAQSAPAPAAFCAYTADSATHRPTVRVTVCGTEGSAVLDTGSRTNMASPQLHRILETNRVPSTRHTLDIYLADGTCAPREVLLYHTTCEIQGTPVPTSFTVLPGMGHTKTLLGMEFMRKAGLRLFLSQDQYALDHCPDDRKPFTQEDPLATVPPVDIPRHSEVAAALAESRIPSLLPPMSPEPTEDHPDVRSGLTAGYGPDPSPNPLSRSGYMWQDAIKQVGQLWANDIDDSMDWVVFDSLVMGPHELRPDEGQGLSQPDRKQLSRLLSNHADVFASHGPPTALTTHQIDTGSHGPIASAPYRLSPGRTQALKGEILELLHSGIIEECETPWSAPAILVPKPDGALRLCIDYRRLNEVTTPDTYPMPRLDDLLHATGRTRVISTMDLKAGYYQVPVHPDHRDKTGFVTPFGLYRFRRMPFGLRNAPATFQRLIDRL